MDTFDCDVLYRPADDSLAFLPEGPIACGHHAFSWVAIQHGAGATSGSLNLFDVTTKTNTTYPIQGRPGFAFPTNRPGVFIVGAERSIGLYDIQSEEWNELNQTVDQTVHGTIINDGLACSAGLIFGCKDLEFKAEKAGLYFWRKRDRQLLKLRSDQICSNGKVLLDGTSRLRFLDIDSPKKAVVEYSLDTESGEISPPSVILDLQDVDAFPDGMVLAPDGRSVIIAFYNPHDVPYGEARLYRLGDGCIEAIWRTRQSPRVTCPLLIEHQGQVKLILTSAVEHMSPEQRQSSRDAGCLFIGSTHFDALPPSSPFEI